MNIYLITGMIVLWTLVFFLISVLLCACYLVWTEWIFNHMGRDTKILIKAFEMYMKENEKK